MATLVKVDRNGTKYWTGMVTCDRCGGAGGADAWAYTGWTCYKCGGEGKVPGSWVERTPEYEAKLAERRAKRSEKMRAETEARRVSEYDANCKATLERNGFSPDGETFLILGDTYSRKDAIKAAGGKFDSCLGWHFPAPVDGFETVKVRFEDVAEYDAWGRMALKKGVFEKANAMKRDAERAGKPVSEYVGEVGGKIDTVVTLVKTAWYEVKDPFGRPETRNVFMFTDGDGNLIVWKTGSGVTFTVGSEWHVVEKGESVRMRATVKDHAEYDGDKQTVVKNCRFKAV